MYWMYWACALSVRCCVGKGYNCPVYWMIKCYELGVPLVLAVSCVPDDQVLWTGCAPCTGCVLCTGWSSAMNWVCPLFWLCPVYRMIKCYELGVPLVLAVSCVPDDQVLWTGCAPCTGCVLCSPITCWLLLFSSGALRWSGGPSLLLLLDY
jgi:hypothetical protein